MLPQRLPPLLLPRRPQVRRQRLFLERDVLQRLSRAIEAGSRLDLTTGEVQFHQRPQLPNARRQFRQRVPAQVEPLQIRQRPDSLRQFLDPVEVQPQPDQTGEARHALGQFGELVAGQVQVTQVRQVGQADLGQAALLRVEGRAQFRVREPEPGEVQVVAALDELPRSSSARQSAMTRWKGLSSEALMVKEDEY